MFNRINSIATAAAMFAAPDSAAPTAPRVLDDLTQAMRDQIAADGAKRSADLKAKAKAKAPAKGNGRAAIAKAIAAKHNANVVAASNKVRRLSRIAPICDQVVELMRGGAKHVAVMAEKVECSERDIRLAIDKLRASAYRIDRVKPMTFGFAKGFKVPSKAKAK